MLTLGTFESFFVFDGKYYKQCDGMAMGSCLRPTLANAFLCHYENLWLQDCPADFKPIIYKRYLDNIFVLFLSKDQHLKFQNYMNSKHINISFTTEVECKTYSYFRQIYHLSLPKTYLKFFFTNFESFLPLIYKI